MRILLALLLLAVPLGATPIRSVTVSSTSIVVVDETGTHTLTFSALTAGQKATPAAAETFMTNTWAASFVSNRYQIVVHVFTVSPFKATVMTIEPGVSAKANWWIP